MGRRMTQQEKDALIGQIVRESIEHERELRTLTVAIKEIGERLTSLGGTLSSAPFAVIADARGKILSDRMSGPFVSDDYKDVLDYERIAGLEQQIREHSRELGRLRGQRADLGV